MASAKSMYNDEPVLRLFDTLPNFLFTTGETKRDLKIRKDQKTLKTS